MKFIKTSVIVTVNAKINEYEIQKYSLKKIGTITIKIASAINNDHKENVIHFNLDSLNGNNLVLYMRLTSARNTFDPKKIKANITLIAQDKNGI